MFALLLFYAVIAFIILLLVCILIVAIKKNKYIVVIAVIVIGIVLGFFWLYKFDFVKKRKCVDVDWLYGKTIEQIGFRYYGPDESEQDSLKDKNLLLGTYEIVYWDPMDSIYTILYYYVELNEQDKVIYVEKRGNDKDDAGERFDYWARWGL